MPRIMTFSTQLLYWTTRGSQDRFGLRQLAVTLEPPACWWQSRKSQGPCESRTYPPSRKEPGMTGLPAQQQVGTSCPDCYREHETLDTAPHPCGTGRLPWQSPPGGESPCSWSRDSLSLDRERGRVRVTGSQIFVAPVRGTIPTDKSRKGFLSHSARFSDGRGVPGTPLPKKEDESYLRINFCEVL